MGILQNYLIKAVESVQHVTAQAQSAAAQIEEKWQASWVRKNPGKVAVAGAALLFAGVTQAGCGGAGNVNSNNLNALNKPVAKAAVFSPEKVLAIRAKRPLKPHVVKNYKGYQLEFANIAGQKVVLETKNNGQRHLYVIKDNSKIVYNADGNYFQIVDNHGHAGAKAQWPSAAAPAATPKPPKINVPGVIHMPGSSSVVQPKRNIVNITPRIAAASGKSALTSWAAPVFGRRGPSLNI